MDYSEKCRLGNDLDTSSETLAKLARDANANVRSLVARNLNTPSEVLAELANDEIAFVRQTVAFNSNTSSDVLRQLSFDVDSDVRLFVASNPSTPADALEILSNDEHKWVRASARRSLTSSFTWQGTQSPTERADSAKQVAASQGTDASTTHNIHH